MANKFNKPEQRLHWNEYNRNYSKVNYKTYTIKLNLVKDKDIIDYLSSSSESFSQTIRELVREKLGK